MGLQERIIREFTNGDRYIIGFADMAGFVEDCFSNYRYAVSIAQRLDDNVVDDICTGPTEDYCELYDQTNLELLKKSHAVSDILTRAGVQSLAIRPTVEDEELDKDYFETLRTSFSHKLPATRSGIGWIGKTDLLVTHRFGPRVRLASVLFTESEHPITVGTPITISKCRHCNVCVQSCPAKAANGKLWKAGIDRDEFYDAFKCREQCREYWRIHMNKKRSICGICVSACPIGMRRKILDPRFPERISGTDRPVET